MATTPVVMLADNFDLKAIILLTFGRPPRVWARRARPLRAGSRWFGTFRRGAVQHSYWNIWNQNAAASSIVSGGVNTRLVLYQLRRAITAIDWIGGSGATCIRRKRLLGATLRHDRRRNPR